MDTQRTKVGPKTIATAAVAASVASVGIVVVLAVALAFVISGDDDRLRVGQEATKHRVGTLRICNRIANRRGAPITSTWRSDSHNRAVGGVPNSLHTHGSLRNPGACDFGPRTERTRQLVGQDCRRAGAVEVLIHAVPGGGRHTHCGWF